MPNPLDALLAARAPVVLDGALATELERRGADLNDPLWSARCLIERPELIRDVHRDYYRAGADIATTATYQATFEGFRRRGIDAPAAARLMRSAVQIAIDARDEFWENEADHSSRLHPLVAASIGPYGAMLADGSEYLGRYAIGDRELRDFHESRLGVLAESGAELLAFETLPCLREAVVLAELLERHRGAYAWISFSCRDGSSTCEGDDIGECAAALERFARVAAVGVNCTRPEFVASLLQRMRAQTAKPLIAYPNSGEAYQAVGKTWVAHGAPHRDAGQSVRPWLEVGARIIGGCCRTTPQDIAAIRAARG